MTEVLVADRGEGKTTAVVDSILAYEFPPGIAGVFVTPTSHHTELLNRLEGHGRRTRPHEIALYNGIVRWHPATLGSERLRGLDRRTPVWIDNAHEMLYGASDRNIAFLNVVLVTALPAPWLYPASIR